MNEDARVVRWVALPSLILLPLVPSSAVGALMLLVRTPISVRSVAAVASAGLFAALAVGWFLSSTVVVRRRGALVVFRDLLARSASFDAHAAAFGVSWHTGGRGGASIYVYVEDAHSRRIVADGLWSFATATAMARRLNELLLEPSALETPLAARIVRELEAHEEREREFAARTQRARRIGWVVSIVLPIVAIAIGALAQYLATRSP